MLRRNRLKPVVKWFGSWAVNSDGIFHAHPRFNYFVPLEHLVEWGWCYHVAGKQWADIRAFEQAVLFARKRFQLPEPKYSDWMRWGAKVG